MKSKNKSPKNKGGKKATKDPDAKSSKQLSTKSGAKPSKSVVPKASRAQETAFLAGKEVGAVDTSQTTKSAVQTIRKATIEDWFDTVRTHMARTAESGAPTGACMVPDANGGSLCVEMTQESCNSPAVKGQWLGGDC